ncbi:hypothetical protein BH24ACT13_BH24ACT13_16010 [soil metagenome]
MVAHVILRGLADTRRSVAVESEQLEQASAGVARAWVATPPPRAWVEDAACRGT